MVRKGCLALERPNCFCIDERIIPFSGRCGMKQYVPNQPNPVGLKNFVLAGMDGVIYDFGIYKGQEAFPDIGLGVAENPVLTLVQTVPTCCTVYFDRWFTSVSLVDEPVKKIFITGTVMKNKIPKGANLVSDKDMKKSPIGTAGQTTRSDNAVACVKWVDKEPIAIVPAALGIEPKGT
ncbi:hypothetical protein HPB47_010607 [Ixodes persulcatus]|uniref:Uncharacterized protein n=1 Tax=Ixodes persulcatus TaxID=34615 RepID=A0AC60NYT0_IXOPE|nr:hypothetical protein HPB47_010607 [Ixodes persulcatus]